MLVVPALFLRRLLVRMEERDGIFAISMELGRSVEHRFVHHVSGIAGGYFVDGAIRHE